jgi:hypothetical protein
MNDYDRNNLNFILTLNNPEDWEAWAETLSEDDLRYALGLVKTAQAESLVQMLDLQEAMENESNDLDCTQALEFINRVKKESL